jgi:hypothetical protein
MGNRGKLAKELEAEIERLRQNGGAGEQHRIKLLEREVQRLREYDQRDAKQGKRRGQRGKNSGKTAVGGARPPKRITSLVSGGLPTLGKRG